MAAFGLTPNLQILFHHARIFPLGADGMDSVGNGVRAAELLAMDLEVDLPALEDEWLMCQRVMWGEHVSFEDYWAAHERSLEIERQISGQQGANHG